MQNFYTAKILIMRVSLSDRKKTLFIEHTKNGLELNQVIRFLIIRTSVSISREPRNKPTTNENKNSTNKE